MKQLKNIPASARQRLLNHSRERQQPFGQVVQYYAMERFLYRLGKSAQVDSFILKGALMLQVWHSPQSRPTMDIDMLGRTSNDEAAVVAQIREIISTDVEPDGIQFDPDSIRTEDITREADYDGIRIRFQGKLDSVTINMQIDIGFGDPVFPAPEMAELPTLLDSPTPRLLCYSRESAIAEKFHAMVIRGHLNSRMKDFFDIWQLSRFFAFDSEKLARAVRLTFDYRHTAVPDNLEVFDPAFVASKTGQWTAFRTKFSHLPIPESFEVIVLDISDFLYPVLAGCNTSSPPSRHWEHKGPWGD